MTSGSNARRAFTAQRNSEPEEAEELHARAPGFLHLCRHVARVGKGLFPLRRVVKTIDVDPVDGFRFGDAGIRRRDHPHLDPFLAERSGEQLKEVA